MGLGHAACAFLHHLGKPITLNTPQVDSMQFGQIDNVVDAVLGRLVIHRPSGEDTSGHKALNVLLGPDPTVDLHEPKLQVKLDTFV